MKRIYNLMDDSIKKLETIKTKIISSPKFGEWISVKDGLPKKRQEVLAYNGSVSDSYGVGYFADNHYGDEYVEWPWFFSSEQPFGLESNQPTHWMPLEPPILNTDK